MKKLICFALLVFSSKISVAQCCPYMGSIVTDPASPFNSDFVRIITQVTMPNNATEISKSFTVTGNTIELRTCYYMGMLTLLSFFSDTFTVGQLNAGTYTINFVASTSSSQTACAVTGSNTTTHTFVVNASPNAIRQIAGIEGLKIFPNPVKDWLSIEFKPSSGSYLTLSITNLLGQCLLFSEVVKPAQELDLSTLSPGAYFINISNGQEKVVLKFLKE